MVLPISQSIPKVTSAAWRLYEAKRKADQEKLVQEAKVKAALAIPSGGLITSEGKLTTVAAPKVPGTVQANLGANTSTLSPGYLNVMTAGQNRPEVVQQATKSLKYGEKTPSVDTFVNDYLTLWGVKNKGLSIEQKEPFIKAAQSEYLKRYGTGTATRSELSTVLSPVLPTVGKLLNPEKPKIDWTDPLWDLTTIASVGSVGAVGTGAKALRALASTSALVAQGGQTIENWDKMDTKGKLMSLGFLALAAYGFKAEASPFIKDALNSPTAKEAAQKLQSGFAAIQEKATASPQEGAFYPFGRPKTPAKAVTPPEQPLGATGGPSMTLPSTESVSPPLAAGAGAASPPAAPPVVTPMLSEGVTKTTQIAQGAKRGQAVEYLKNTLNRAYKSQQQERSAELSQRVAKARAIIEANPNDPQAIAKSTAALKGQMPKGAATVKYTMTDADWDTLRLDLLDKTKNTDYFTALHAREWIDDAQAHLADPTNALPIKSNRLAFEKVFPDFDTGILEKATMGADLGTPPQGVTGGIGTILSTEQARQIRMLPESQRTQLMSLVNKAGAAAMDVGDALRTIQASGDVSFTFRQGLLASIRHPVAGAKSFGRGLKALVSPKYAEAVEHIMKTDPYANRFVGDGGFLAPLDPASVTRVMREEGFTSRFAQKIPGIRASSRSYTTAANSLRLDVATQGYKILDKMGADTSEYKAFAEFVNLLTGRGTIKGERMQQLATVLNDTLFSPRLMLSRLQLPAKLASSSPFVRRQAAETLAALVGFTGTVLGLSALAGGTVELDPRSAAFGKLRIGDTYLDITGGFTQYLRTAVRLATGQIKQPGGDVKDKARLETLVSFLQSKESPMFSLVTDLLAGQTYAGEPLTADLKTLGTQALQRLTPLAIQSTVDAMVKEGFIGGLPTASEFVGVGTVTYPSPPPAIIPPTTATPQLLAALDQEIKANKVNIGRVSEIIGAVKLTEDETQEYQRLAGKLVGQAMMARIQETDYLAMPPAERADALRLVANRAKQIARDEFILKSGIALPHKGDSPQMAQARTEWTRMAPYLTAMSQIQNDDAQSTIGNIMRYLDPGLDVSLRLNGKDRNSGAATTDSDSSLSRRKNGAIEGLPGQPITDAQILSLRKMIEPYYDIPRYVWSTLPAGSEDIAKQITKLESQGRTSEARTLTRQNPTVFYGMKQIERYKEIMRRQNPQLADYIRMFG